MGFHRDTCIHPVEARKEREKRGGEGKGGGKKNYEDYGASGKVQENSVNAV